MTEQTDIIPIGKDLRGDSWSFNRKTHILFRDDAKNPNELGSGINTSYNEAKNLFFDGHDFKAIIEHLEEIRRHRLNIRGLTVYAMKGGDVSIKYLPPKFIALDGAVRGPVIGDHKDRWSFDHHTNCIRMTTISTCEQVFTAIGLGFIPKDRPILINDVDADVLMSLWLIIQEGHYVTREEKEAVARLTRAIGMIDSHGPAAKRIMTPGDAALATEFFGRLKDVIPHNTQSVHDQWFNLILTGLSIIDGILMDIADGYTFETNIYPKPKIDVLYDGYASNTGDAPNTGFRAIIASSDLNGFDELYNRGYQVVVLMEPAAKGTFKYTVGKISDIIRYQLGDERTKGTLLHRLSGLENGWGGGTSIGGSPRLADGVSSRMTPHEIWQAMNGWTKD